MRWRKILPIAFQAVLHNFVLATFYRFASSGSCLEIGLRTPTFPAQAPGLRESASAKAIEARHEAWKARLPKGENDLWDALTALDGAAHRRPCSLTVRHLRSTRSTSRPTATIRAASPPTAYARGLITPTFLARAVGLDMVSRGWKPTVDNYLGRVTKPRILEAVREAKGEQSAQLIDHLKKGDMAKEAERLLEATGWLPEPLRLDEVGAVGEPAADPEALPEFLAAGEDEADTEADDERPHIIAAE